MSIKLKENQFLAVELFAQGYKGSEVAERLGVRQETVSRWRQRDSFKSAIHKATQDIQEHSRTKLNALRSKSIHLIEKTIDDETVNLRHRLTCAINIVKLTDKSAFQSPPEEDPIDNLPREQKIKALRLALEELENDNSNLI